MQINKIKNDKQIKKNAMRDSMGNFFALQDGRAKWHKRKAYVVNFAKVMYMLGSEELKKAEDSGILNINKETGEVFDTPEARKYFLKHIRMTECSLRLGFKIDSQNAVRLFNAHFCRDRLCAICMWRLSRRVAWETSLIIDRYTAENPDMIPILIGLTVRNPKMGELSQMLDVLCNGKSGAWQILQKRLARRGIKDYIRTLEITLNSKEKSWHPHIHVLAFVPKEYFKKGSKNYLLQAQLRKEWKEICNLDYEPIVDIRRCYDKNKPNERIDFNDDTQKIDLSRAVKETSKYCVKPLQIFFKDFDNAETGAENSFIFNVKDVVRELSNALHGRRLRALGGKLKQIAKDLKLDDDESKKDLLHKDENGTADAIWEEIYEYVFGDEQYYLTAREAVEQEQSTRDSGKPTPMSACHADERNFAPDAQPIRTSADKLDGGPGGPEPVGPARPDGQLANTEVGKLGKIFADGANIFSLKFEQGAKNFRAVGVEGLAPVSAQADIPARRRSLPP